MRYIILGLFILSSIACGEVTVATKDTGGTDTGRTDTGGTDTGGTDTGGTDTGGTDTGGTDTGGTDTGGTDTGGTDTGGTDTGGTDTGGTDSSPALCGFPATFNITLQAGQSGACLIAQGPYKCTASETPGNVTISCADLPVVGTFMGDCTPDADCNCMVSDSSGDPTVEATYELKNNVLKLTMPIMCDYDVSS